MTEPTSLQTPNVLLHERDALGVHRLTLNSPASFNTLSDGALGNLGNLGTAASVLGLFQAVQDGDTAGTAAGVNARRAGTSLIRTQFNFNGLVNSTNDKFMRFAA